MLNTSEIELIYAVLSDTAMTLDKNNNHHLGTEIQQLAGRFLEEFTTTDDRELEYQDMLNHSHSDENEVIDAIETNQLKQISDDIYNHLFTILSKNIVSKNDDIISLNFVGYSVQFVVCMDSTVDVLVETKTKPTIGVKYNYELNQVLNFDNLKVRKIICSVHQIERP